MKFLNLCIVLMLAAFAIAAVAGLKGHPLVAAFLFAYAIVPLSVAYGVEVRKGQKSVAAKLDDLGREVAQIKRMLEPREIEVALSDGNKMRLRKLRRGYIAD